MIRQAAFHRGRDSQCPVNPNEIVDEVLKRHGRNVILQLSAAEAISRQIEWLSFEERAGFSQRVPQGEVPMTAKDTVRALLDRLPGDCSLDEVL